VLRRKRWSVGLIGLHSGQVHNLGALYHFRFRRKAEAVAGALQRLDLEYSSLKSPPLTRWVVLRDGRIPSREYAEIMRHAGR
jgi:hypothetical protein